MLALTPSLREEIKEACAHWNDGEVNRMLRKGVSPQNLLIIGCQAGSIPLIHAAMEGGANIDEKDHESWTPLMHASYFDHDEAIATLLDYAAPVHSRTPQGESALAIAKEERNQGAIKVFDEKLKKIRLRHAGILIDALKTIERERAKSPELRDRRALALSCIDRAYVWWVGEEYPHKVLDLFAKAFHLDRRVGAFPYASILSASGHHENALDILELIQRQGWQTIPRTHLIDCGLFDCLEVYPRWKKIMRLWPEH